MNREYHGALKVENKNTFRDDCPEGIFEDENLP